MNSNIQLCYFIGILFLAIFWLISYGITRNPNPFAMAKGSGKGGENDYFNASLVQMIVFTMLTIFAYTTVFAARAVLNEGKMLLPGEGNDWLKVPTNLLILMGISVGTAVASRAIKTQQKNNETQTGHEKSESEKPTDQSSLTTDSKGRTDLIKIQMLVWTVIAVIVYLTILYRFMEKTCFLSPLPTGCPTDWGNTLPDIDSAFMVLLGVSQGGYVLNKLSQEAPKDETTKTVENNKSPDTGEIKELASKVNELLKQANEKQLPAGAQPAIVSKVLIEPTEINLTDQATEKQLKAKVFDAQENEITDLPEGSFKWSSDDTAVAVVDEKGLVKRVTKGDCGVIVTVNGIASNKCAVKCG